MPVFALNSSLSAAARETFLRCRPGLRRNGNRSASRGRSRATLIHISLLLSLYPTGCVPVAKTPPGITATRPVEPQHATLNQRVMVGYQGWYRTPGDGSGLGWTHYQNNRTR